MVVRHSHRKWVGCDDCILQECLEVVPGVVLPNLAEPCSLTDGASAPVQPAKPSKASKSAAPKDSDDENEDDPTPVQPSRVETNTTWRKLLRPLRTEVREGDFASDNQSVKLGASRPQTSPILLSGA